MNPVADFFRRHHAVPANDRSPQWRQATDAALLDWWNAYAGIVRCGWNRELKRDATIEERRALLPLYQQIAAEIQRRAEESDASPEIMGAYFISRMRFVLPA
jgi:hypothetical protein